MDLDTLFNITAASLVVLVFILFIALWLMFRHRQKERAENERLFIKKLKTAFEQNTVKNIQIAVDFYKGFFDTTDLKLKDHEQLSQFIRKISLEIASDTDIEKSKAEKLITLCVTLSEENQQLIEEQQKRIPFSGTPQLERGLLEDILELTSADKSIVHNKLNELAKLIRTREDTINRLSEDNKKVITWSRLGVIGTILFGIISLILAIIQLFG